MKDPRRIRYSSLSRKQDLFSRIMRTSATNQLILINIIVFIAAVLLIFVFGAGFFDYLALKPSDIIQGRNLWTLFTHMFMHSPSVIFHLPFNMVSLFFIGNLMEKIIGRKRYLVFYIISGLVAGLVFVLLSFLIGDSFILGTGSEWSAVGASGALFGVAGLMALLTPGLPLYVMFIPVPIKAKYAVPGLLALIVLISAYASWPVGNSAHLGGLLTGIAYGVYLKKKYKRKTAMISKYFSG